MIQWAQYSTDRRIPLYRALFFHDPGKEETL